MKITRPKQLLVVDVGSCARCGLDHPKLEFKPLTNPVQDSDGTLWNWWTLCPINGEPILLKIVDNV